VRLSRDLERDAISSGYVNNWQHTNARRSVERKAYRLRRLSPGKAPRPAGQLPLLPELDRPVARLRQFGGGFVPRAVAVEIEFRRQQLGLSQQQLASRIGRSQGQLANALRGHDPISSAAVNRLREVLITQALGLASLTWKQQRSQVLRNFKMRSLRVARERQGGPTRFEV
jgi:hypothetical protein